MKLVKSLCVCLSDFEQALARKHFNKKYVGDETVNMYDKNKNLVGKYDDHPNYPKLLELHRKLARTYINVEVDIEIQDDGSLKVIGLRPKP